MVAPPRVCDVHTPGPASGGVPQTAMSPPRSTSPPGSAGQAARIAASARAAAKPLPIPPRSTAAPRSTRARPRAGRRGSARPHATLRPLRPRSASSSKDRSRRPRVGKDRRWNRPPCPCGREAPLRARRGAARRLQPIRRGTVESRQVAARIEARRACSQPSPRPALLGTRDARGRRPADPLSRQLRRSCHGTERLPLHLARHAGTRGRLSSCDCATLVEGAGGAVRAVPCALLGAAAGCARTRATRPARRRFRRRSGRVFQ